jgi:hypothetical protein
LENDNITLSKFPEYYASDCLGLLYMERDWINGKWVGNVAEENEAEWNDIKKKAADWQPSLK